jgi:diaminopimelate epimerase
VTTLGFSKYQAAGNDFLLVEDLDGALHLGAEEVRDLCDRWQGVGADGVIRVRRAERAPIAMDLVNADGTPAEISGNGMRCVAAFARDRDLVQADEFEIESRAGVHGVAVERADARVARATVEIGEPNFTKAAIPMFGPAWETFLEQPFDLGGGLKVVASALSMGNPHLVLFVDEDLDRYHVEHLGPALEHHEWFPERTNVEFARIADGGSRIDVRVWERGVGETLACGTGACAVAVAANEAGRAPTAVAVGFRGGDLAVERRDDGHVLLGGPVSHVFDGTVDPGSLA